MSQNNNYSLGLSTSSLLGVAFVVLKLCGVINWSWWLVTFPFWAGLAILLTLGGIFIAGILALLLGAAAASGIKKLKKK